MLLLLLSAQFMFVPPPREKSVFRREEGLKVCSLVDNLRACGSRAPQEEASNLRVADDN